MLIINDTHLGVSRKGGTTPQSRQQLRDYTLAAFEELLYSGGDMPLSVLIAGDLFDAFTVDTRDVIAVYEIIYGAFDRGMLKDLTLMSGNHDASAKGEKVSSFHLLAHFLRQMFPAQVRIVDHDDGLAYLGSAGQFELWAIAHQLNQDLFDQRVQDVLGLEPAEGIKPCLILHCNIKNSFAQEADHSLNLSGEQLDTLMRAGWHVICAHEHQQRTLRSGRLIVPGNQIPTSVADLLGCDGKYLVEVGESLELKRLPMPANFFVQTDWRDINVPDDARFVRVVGDATSAEAAQALDTVAHLRQRHDAFVVANAVKIEGLLEMDTLAEMSLEQISAFNVLENLLEELSAPEGELVKELLEC